MIEPQKGLCYIHAWSHGDPASGGYVTTYFVVVIGEEKDNWWRRLWRKPPRWTVMVWDINFASFAWELLSIEQVPAQADVLGVLQSEQLRQLIFDQENFDAALMG